MCARFSIPTDDVIGNLFGLSPDSWKEFEVPMHQRFNFAPSLYAPLVMGADREPVALQWGIDLHSDTWKGPLINVKSETAMKRFGSMVSGGRLLVATLGFFEWQDLQGKKQPFAFVRRDRKPFAMACLQREGRFAVLTTEPNADLVETHDRMPSMISPDDYDLWLSGTPEEAIGLALNSFGDGILEKYMVNPAMGNPRFEDSGILNKWEPDQGSLF